MRPFPVAPLSCRVRPVHQATQLTTLRLPQSVYMPMIAARAGISNEIRDLNALSALGGDGHGAGEGRGGRFESSPMFG
ncbi:hypothetical protein ASG86_11720 [Arthrobacter sp. Soil764]|nr:hypothetical protein ASG86_11720 [Arthrobacter sp. Soil764]